MKIFLSVLFMLFAVTANAEVTVTPQQSIFEGQAIIAKADIYLLIEDKMLEYDLEENIKIDIRGYDSGISLKQKYDEYKVSLVEFDLRQRSRVFNAKLAFEHEGYRELVDLSGRYNEMVKLPVLSLSVPYNTVIQNDDITYMEYEKSRMRHDTITEASDLVGNVMKHTGRAMRPIRLRDVVRERVVSKNDTLNLVYETEFMTLRTSGIALQDGAKGDVVRVRSGGSSKIVDAIVVGANSAVVKPEKL